MVALTLEDLQQSRNAWDHLTREYPLALPKVIENLPRHTHLPG